MRGRKIDYSWAELYWIEENSTRPRKEAHAEFQHLWDRPDVSLANFNSLCKRNGWMTGRTGCFAKGQEPANKGKGMSDETKAKVSRTWFKKGQMPHTWRGPGHESIDNKDGYVWMIVAERNPHTGAPTRRVQKHKWLWEKANGPVPDGHVLKCLDGDKTNTDPSNWKAVPRALLPRLSGRWTLAYDDAPAELKPTLMATAELAHAARQARKEKNHGQS